MRDLIKINTPINPQSDPNEIFEKKRAMLLSDPVVYLSLIHIYKFDI